jgi:hypothetical protein
MSDSALQTPRFVFCTEVQKSLGVDLPKEVNSAAHVLGWSNHDVEDEAFVRADE